MLTSAFKAKSDVKTPKHNNLTFNNVLPPALLMHINIDSSIIQLI
jgi:hypothetical protein